MADDRGTKKKVLAGGTLLTAIVWEAIKAGELQFVGTDSRKLAEIQELLRTGKAALSVYLERSGEQLYLAAALVEPSQSCPFSGTVLEARGPVVSSIDELQALALQAPRSLH